MIDVVSIDQCVLCGACMDSCPVGAISLKKEYRGNYYPQINGRQCIECQRCERVCPIINVPEAASYQGPMGYAAMHGEDAVRKESSSGGVFAALADAVISDGGYVCGAVMTDDKAVEHIVSNDCDQIKRMRGSKYVQSHMAGVYRKVEELVKQNIPVLFSGCPCQTAAMKAFLGGEYSSLYLVDVICHGIPAVSSWETYLALQEKRYGSRVKEVRFRDKTKGWHSSSMKLRFSNGKTYLEPITADTYFRGFLGNITLKESCYHCAFREFKSGADITLGDFWGAETALADIDDNKGLSAVLVHTEKGTTLLEKTKIFKQPVPYEMILRGNKSLVESFAVSPIREAYYQCREACGEEAAMRKFLCDPLLKKVARRLRYILRWMKHALKREKMLY